MSRKDRHQIYEGAAIVAAGMGLAFAVPTLASAHDSIALLAGGLLAFAWAGWGAFFAYRATKGEV